MKTKTVLKPKKDSVNNKTKEWHEDQAPGNKNEMPKQGQEKRKKSLKK